jgi:Uma2 family endonuclease
VFDLLWELGIDASRVRLPPPPGTATESDVIAAYSGLNRRLCELVKGFLVEKVPGHYESRLTTVLGYYLEQFLVEHNFGYAVGPNAFLRLLPGLVRSPALSYTSWERLPQRRVPRVAIADVVPNLIAEVPRRANTGIEMKRKRQEYFDAGVEIVWQIDPDARTCEVFTSADESTVIGVDGIVDGGRVLPGFQLSLREFFARADGGSTAAP